MRKTMMCLVLGMLWLLSSGVARAETRRGGNNDGVAQGAAAAGVVNVNEANEDQLVLLPGIGPSRAQAIVAHRKSHPFKRVEELTRIKGIGKKTFAKLKPLVALSGPTTLTERPGKKPARER